MAGKKITPRGIRNNNPLNIRIGNTWLGERHPSEFDDPDFEQFISMTYGLRAAFCILRRYIRHYHRNTVAKIIQSWAPSNENDTNKYVQFICSAMQCTADDEIHYEDSATMCELVQAMGRYECGVKIPLAEIEKAYKLA